MAILPVLQFPDERLRIKAKTVPKITEETEQIIANMIETMYSEEGIGLAATQVDIHQRIIVIDISDSKDAVLVLVNPGIKHKEGATAIEEGCLSVSDVRAVVPRYEKVTITALDRHGVPFELAADGLLAICIQHELDHLEGKLFIDYLSPLKRQRINQKLEKQARHLSRTTNSGNAEKRYHYE